MLNSIKFIAAINYLRNKHPLKLVTLYDNLRKEIDALETQQNTLKEKALVNNVEIAEIERKIVDCKLCMTATLEAKKNQKNSNLPNYKQVENIVLYNKILLDAICNDEDLTKTQKFWLTLKTKLF